MTRRSIRERNILFLSTDNSCSSRIAEAIAKRLAPPETRVFSADVTPSELHPAVAKVMSEVEIDMSNQRPKGLEAIPINDIDLVVALGATEEKLPMFPPNTRLERWSIPDPPRMAGEEAKIQTLYRYVRDEIDKKVAALFLDYWRNLTH